MSFITDKELKIKKLLKELNYEVDNVKLELSSRPEFGMYQYNGAMALAKTQCKNPREIAEIIANKLTSDEDLTNINIQGPGFINISFTNTALTKYMNEMLEDVKVSINKYKSKKVIIDYGGANVAKTLHVGHLRSANIGEALKRLAILCGYEVISDVHLGDFGRQIGMVILEIKNRYPNLPYFDENFKGEYPKESPITSKDLETIYPIANVKAKENPEIMEEARRITNELQKGHPGYTALWKHIVDVSVSDIKNIYDTLNTSFDYWYGESDSYKYIKEMTEYLEKKKILKQSEGAIIIDVSKDDDKKEIPPLLLYKSNKAVSYEATDLATIWQRQKDFNPDEIWYVVDNRQELHFIQTFRAAYLSKIVSANTKLEFLGFGTMNGKDGKPFKTRDGGVMSLNDLINKVKEQTYKLVSENIEDKEKVAKIVAISALKYADLLPTRSKDYIFDIEKFCDVQGKTGPYILYSTVRINSLLQKDSINNYNLIDIYNDYDKDIVINLLNLTKTIDNAIRSKSLNDICEYLFKLNNSYNNFYNEYRILTEEDINKKNSWLALSKIVYDVNKLLLDVLAINIPDKM